MKAFNELTLKELEQIRKVYDEIISQIGGIVVQDYHTLLVTIPKAIDAEIKNKNKEDK